MNTVDNDCVLRISPPGRFMVRGLSKCTWKVILYYCFAFHARLMGADEKNGGFCSKAKSHQKM